MRVTQTLRRDEAVRQIQDNLARLADLQRQISTGKRFSRMEDDPVAATQVIQIKRSNRALEQFAKNSITAQVRLGAEEAVVTQLDQLLRDGRNIALSFGKGDPPYTPAQTIDRQQASDRLTLLLDQAISLGNTQIGNEYILAGDRSTTPPFDPAAGATYGNYQGGTQQRRTEITDGMMAVVNHTGNQFVGPAIAALKALRDAVDPANSQTEAQVQAEVTNVYNQGQGLMVSLAQTGSTGSQIAATLKSNITYKNDLENLRGSLEDVPMEEALAKSLSLQTTIAASYSATSRLLGLTLTDYLG
jgi:flagellar hook-associated protein 3 FlgL